MGQTGNGMCFGKGAYHPTHFLVPPRIILPHRAFFVRIFLLAGKIIHGGMRSMVKTGQGQFDHNSLPEGRHSRCHAPPLFSAQISSDCSQGGIKNIALSRKSSEERYQAKSLLIYISLRNVYDLPTS